MEFILETTKTGLDIIDSDFNICFVDAAWKKVYGTAQEKMLSYFMGRDKPCDVCGVQKAMETKSKVITEEVLAKEDNRVVQVTTIPFQTHSENGFVLKSMLILPKGSAKKTNCSRK